MSIHHIAQQIRVANIIEESKLGGPQSRIVMAAAALKGRVETTVFMPKENSEPFRQRCEAYGVDYKVLGITHITKEWRVALRYVLFSFVEVIRLASFLKRGEFDLVHVSGGSWQYKGVIAGRLAGKKIIWHLNDTSMPYLFRKLFSLFSRFADGYIYASERSKQYYGSFRKNGKQEFVIPAPVDVSQFDPTHSYEGEEELIKQWIGKTVIGTVANINPIKGLELFIRSAALLNKKQSSKLVFVIIGAAYPRQKAYLERLQDLCEELSVKNIEFLGPRSDIRPLLKRFDIYVCSSLAESSPLSVWEAMAMEKPVVSTNVGDVPLYVHTGHSGSIVDVGDIKTMAEQISMFIDNKELRENYGSNARKIAVQELDVRKCAERHLEAYKNMTEYAPS